RTNGCPGLKMYGPALSPGHSLLTFPRRWKECTLLCEANAAASFCEILLRPASNLHEKILRTTFRQAVGIELSTFLPQEFHKASFAATHRWYGISVLPRAFLFDSCM